MIRMLRDGSTRVLCRLVAKSRGCRRRHRRTPDLGAAGLLGVADRDVEGGARWRSVPCCSWRDYQLPPRRRPGVLGVRRGELAGCLARAAEPLALRLERVDAEVLATGQGGATKSSVITTKTSSGIPPSTSQACSTSMSGFGSTRRDAAPGVRGRRARGGHDDSALSPEEEHRGEETSQQWSREDIGTRRPRGQVVAASCLTAGLGHWRDVPDSS